MPFHVEVRRSYHRAWAFNLDSEELRRTVLEPWVRGAPLRIGDRDWDPSQSSLRVLEGARLAPADLAHGQGWNRAERSGRDVARELLAGSAMRPPAAATIVAPSGEARDAAAGLLRALGVTVVDFASVRAALLPPVQEAVAAQVALVLVEAAAPEGWHFDAGLALGAFGPRAVFVSLAPGGPAPLAGIPVAGLDAADPAAPGMLAEALRRAGCAVTTTPAPAP
jgi:hypothetical protein